MAFRVGDLVREIGGTTLYRLDDINPAEPPGVDEYWASGSTTDFRTAFWDSPDEVELVMSADDALKRTAPSVTQVRDHLVSTAHSLRGDEGFTVDETGPDDSRTLYINGETDEGLRFSALVQVVQVFEEEF